MTMNDQRRQTGERPAIHVPTDAPVLFSNDERNAMRAYLQRCEVRLSTLHRVVTGLISGAGLMVLVPVFFKDAVSGIIQLLLQGFVPMLERHGTLAALLVYAAMLPVMYVLLFIPVRALYLLFKDIIDFYFGLHTPGFPREVETPTFALTGVAFSPDESPRVKREVLRYQYRQESIDFMVPFSKGKRMEYFHDLEANRALDRVQTIRSLQALRDAGLIPHDDPDYDLDALHFNAALSLSRSIERDLVQEVAKTEMSLTRHVMFLRRMVLRYVKTTLVFLWTLLAVFMTESVIASGQFPPFSVLALGCLLWSLPVTWIMHMPIEWIYRPITGVKDTSIQHNRIAETLKFIADFVRGPQVETTTDPQLVVMEMSVKRLRHVAVVLSAVALILSLYYLV